MRVLRPKSAVLAAVGCMAIGVCAALVPASAAAAAQSGVSSKVTNCDGAVVKYPTKPGGVLTPAAVGERDTPQTRAWFKQMANRHVTWLHDLKCEAIPASTIQQPGDASPLTSSYIPNWGGYVNSHVPAGANSGMGWYVPSVNGSPSGSSAAVWVGQGGFNGNGTLAQTGSLSEPNGSGGTTSYLWWEIVPGYSIQKITNLAGPVGASISATMDTDSDRSVDFNLCNTVSGQCAYISKTASKAIGGSVEWVTERIDVGGYYTQLAKFGTVTINNPKLGLCRQGLHPWQLHCLRHAQLQRCDHSRLNRPLRDVALPVLQGDVEGLWQQRKGLLSEPARAERSGLQRKSRDAHASARAETLHQDISWRGRGVHSAEDQPGDAWAGARVRDASGHDAGRGSHFDDEAPLAIFADNQQV
jgi:hypothetical protein